MESVNTGTSTSVKPLKPFGKLDTYDNRALFVNSEAEITEVIDILKAKHGVSENVVMKTVRLVMQTPDGEASGQFRYFELPGKPRVYCLTVPNRAAGHTAMKTLFDLAALTRVSIVVYVHPEAIALINIPQLHNFPSILLHTQEDVNTYFGGSQFGDDEKEILFCLRQKQKYVVEEIVPRDQRAKDKAAKKQPKAKETDAGESPLRSGKGRGAVRSGTGGPERKKKEVDAGKGNVKKLLTKDSYLGQRLESQTARAETQAAPLKVSFAAGECTCETPTCGLRPGETHIPIASIPAPTSVSSLAKKEQAKPAGYAQAAKKNMRPEPSKPSNANAEAPRSRGARPDRHAKAVAGNVSGGQTWVLPQEDKIATPEEQIRKANVVAEIPTTGQMHSLPFGQSVQMPPIPAPQTYYPQTPGLLGFPNGFPSQLPNVPLTPAMWNALSQMASQMAGQHNM
jgi:hypothetical protein